MLVGEHFGLLSHHYWLHIWTGRWGPGKMVVSWWCHMKENDMLFRPLKKNRLTQQNLWQNDCQDYQVYDWWACIFLLRVYSVIDSDGSNGLIFGKRDSFSTDFAVHCVRLLVFDEKSAQRLGLAQVLTNLTVRHRVRVASKAQISIGLPCLYHCIISIFYIFYYMFFRIS